MKRGRNRKMEKAVRRSKKSRVFLSLLTILTALTLSSALGRQSGDKSAEEIWKAGGGRSGIREMVRVETLDEGVIVMKWGSGAEEISARFRLLFQSGNIFPAGPGTAPVAPFRKVGVQGGADFLFEGCPGGNRTPGIEADDDGDGKINEDRVDGMDNDRDGRVDEDFVAIGERMYVAQAAVEECGGRIINKCYTWTYDPVIDIVGITTIFEKNLIKSCCPSEGGDARLSLGVDFEFGGFKNSGEDIYARAVTEYLEFTDDSLRAVIFSNGSMFAGVVLMESNPRGLVDYRIARSPGPNLNSGNDSLTVTEKLSGISGRIDDTGYLKAAATRFVLENVGLEELNEGKIEWAIFFADSEREIERAMRMALKTYKGTVGDNGRSSWVVPPLRKNRINLETSLATVWRENRKEKAVVMKTPIDLVDRNIKWISVEGSKISNYSRAGIDILIPMGNTADNRDSIRIEGEFTGGMLFFGQTGNTDKGEESAERITDEGRLPRDFMKLYPNPFVERVNIILTIPRSGEIKGSNSTVTLGGDGMVRIYDVKGMLVQSLIENKIFYPGEYSAFWDGRDKRGEQVAPGVYYCKLQIGSRTLTKRIVLLR